MTSRWRSLGEVDLQAQLLDAVGEDDGEDGGDERDPPGEPVFAALAQLLGIRELDLRHRR